ncbi:MAG: glutamine synthetase family protein [Candidatus Spyradocola sp.]|jgi:glutamine synthetase
MSNTDNEVLQFVIDNDVKFIRLAFCDVYGTLKNISIMAEELPRAFEYGVAFDAGLVDGFADLPREDLVLHPDASTLEVLPWRPQTGRVARFYCDITTGSGEPFEQDGRQILRRALQSLLDEGYTARIGAKCEFYLFRLDEKGDPTAIPHDRASFLDVAPLDRGENVRRDICLTLEEMGIRPLSSHHEMGPGQNEIAIAPADPMTAANHCVTFRNLVGTIAARNGLFADMGPKPIASENGSGFRINFSLSHTGRSLFLPGEDGELLPEAQSFLAGVLEHMPEMTVFCNSASASYARLRGKSAPKGVGWSRMGRGHILRLPPPQGDTARFELRSPDNFCNPYVVYALTLLAGLDGVHRRLPLPEPETILGPALPTSLQEAAALAAASPFLQAALPRHTLAAYARATAR